MRIAWILLPAILLLAVLAYLLIARPLDRLSLAAPPVEELAVERTRLSPGEIELTIRADGSEPLRLAQVQVDGAWRLFTVAPPGPVGRLARAVVTVPYPWVEGETHHILLLTATGVAFEHSIDVAIATPRLGGGNLAPLLLVGLLLGLVPVAIGLLAYPAMRRAGPQTLQLLLAVTVGLLLYLFIDTLGEGLEQGAAALGRLRGETVVWVAALAAALGLTAFGRRSGRAPEGRALAWFIALGIGLHNFGEGLAVGAALATGAAALATFLVAGFVLHNVTEGIGIAAPLVTARPTLPVFAGLAALAGLPAVVGILTGTSAVSPYAVAICFGLAAGAILQVIVEVAALMVRRSGAQGAVNTRAALGILGGVLTMYATALFV